MRWPTVLVALSLSSIVNAACDVNVTPSDNLQSFYPAGSQRREETGAVVLEIKVEFGQAHPVDIRIVKSSGYSYLDEAAVNLAKAFAIRTDCLNGTIQRTVHFDKEPNPPRSENSDFSVAGPAYIWIED